MIEINERTFIPESEINFTFSRSSGPGGQNVNKVNTRATLLFDARNSPSLSEEQKELVLDRLKGRINREGILRVISHRYRTQGENRDAAMTRFAELLHYALERRTVRRETKVPFITRQKRLEEKKRRSEVKRDRGKAGDFEE
ncbi:MAG: alternative ribosome rescue aminoacyl-tRNA hydrolase ArfB [Candidatus Latescibacter sp.]|nr:alternative ribosome rescue aminoacyl-tRNA hydrolase ArfB [Candidatus Latescibacter sp.]